MRDLYLSHGIIGISPGSQNELNCLHASRLRPGTIICGYPFLLPEFTTTVELGTVN